MCESDDVNDCLDNHYNGTKNCDLNLVGDLNERIPNRVFARDTLVHLSLNAESELTLLGADDSGAKHCRINQQARHLLSETTLDHVVVRLIKGFKRLPWIRSEMFAS